MTTTEQQAATRQAVVAAVRAFVDRSLGLAGARRRRNERLVAAFYRTVYAELAELERRALDDAEGETGV